MSDCDHFVGYADPCWDSGCLHYDESWVENKMDLQELDGKFNFCPKCGAKIDWMTIEQRVQEAQ